MLRYPSVERIERTVKRRTLNWIRRLPCTGTLLSGLKLRVQLAVGEIADLLIVIRKICLQKIARYRVLPAHSSSTTQLFHYYWGGLRESQIEISRLIKLDPEDGR